MKRLFVVIIVIFAALLRLYRIDILPIGFTQDEAGIGYEAYSILQTGKDSWGNLLPLSLRSFGDYKLPLYSYLAIIPIKIFGLNVFSVRLVNGIIGSLTIVFVYLMVKKMFDNELLGVISAIFLTLSPWHISLSRGAFEANLSTFFVTAGIFYFLAGIKEKKFMWVSVFLFGINLFSYHSARLFTPFIFFSLPYFFYPVKQGVIRKYLQFGKEYLAATLVFLSILIIAFSTIFTGSAKRGADVVISNPTDNWAHVADRRYEAVVAGVPDPIARIFSNKLTYVSKQFFDNYVSYLSPDFLFVKGAGEYTYGMIKGRGVMYFYESILIIFTLMYIAKKRDRNLIFLLVWVLFAVIPPALSKGMGNAANRASQMMTAINILSAYGLYLTIYFVKRSRLQNLLKGTFMFMVVLVSFVSFSFFMEDYLFHNPKNAAYSMHYGVSDLIQYLKVHEDEYDQILISKSLSVPNIWVAFYGKVSPSTYQNESRDWLRYESEGFKYVDQLGRYRLGKYIFSGIDMNAFGEDHSLIVVGRPEEFPDKVKTTKVFYYPDNTPSYYIVTGK